MDDSSPPQGQIPELVVHAAAGDRAAIVELLERYRPRLRRMVALHLDARLRGRVDASDVIQEGYLNAMRRLDKFIRDPAVPFYIWLRFLVGQQVHDQHRRHLDAPGRDVGPEVSIYRGLMPGASTGNLAARLLDGRIPRDLETIVLKAIEKDPKRRYASALALADDLGHFLRDEPIRARQVGAAEWYWRWARRNPWIAVLGGVLTAVLVVATVGSLLAAWRFERAARDERESIDRSGEV
jgi:DNA-directed RNA polymerase specialized sigma24 family protein